MADTTIAEKIAQAETERQRIAANIADAYDEAEAKGATMPATENSANLAQTVASIPTGSTPTLQSKTVTPTTSQQSVTPDSGYDGLSDVTVNATPLEAKTVTPTSQQQVVTPTAPNIGLSSVTVGAAPTPTLITKQISANGTYTAADDDADGYSEVTVAVEDASKEALNGIISRDLTEIVSEATQIGNYAFYFWASLTSGSFPNVTSVGAAAFYGCSALSNISIPSARTIYTSAFRNCTSLAKILLPNATTINRLAFDGCTDLTTLILKERATLNDGNAIPTQTIVYVKNSDLAWYSTATNWSAIYADGRIKSIDELP